jgi:LacI family transcriptional regulator
MRKRLQIALLVETSSRYGRGVLTGIAKYLNNCPHWSILLEEIDVHHVAPRWLEKQSVHGIISRVTDEYLRDYAAKMQIPIVELTDRYADTELHALRSDDQTIGEMAAEHLMERGFRNFAFCGFLGEAWSQRRYKGVQERLTEAGFVSHCLDSD